MKPSAAREFQKVGLALVLALFLPPAAVAAGPDLGKAEALIRSGRAAEAAALLEPHEFDYAGTPDFDYLLGVAELESGHADRATLALERALAVSPGFLGARLDLARAYFSLGQYELAAAEFNALKQRNPPPEARKAIDDYLAAIEARSAPQKPVTFSGYAEATIGHDSNVNNATGQGQVFVPGFGGSIQLSATSVETADRYLVIGAGGEVNIAANDALSFFGGVDYRQRAHHEDDPFDTTTWDARVGAAYKTGSHVVRGALSTGTLDLDNAYYRYNSALNLDWRMELDGHNLLGAFVQYNALRYRSELQRPNSSNLELAGVNWMRSLDDRGRNLIGVAGFFGFDRETDTRTDGDKELFGARIMAQHGLRDDFDLWGAVGYQNGRYNRENALFSNFREDHQFDVSLGGTWRFTDHWTMRPLVAFTKVDSNIAIYEYDRTDVSLSLRRDFR